jgi:hypothetical protein
MGLAGNAVSKTGKSERLTAPDPAAYRRGSGDRKASRGNPFRGYFLESVALKMRGRCFASAAGGWRFVPH